MNEEYCPICNREMEDRRHVSIECFYKVNEIVPQAKESVVFKEIPEDASIWGITRHYPTGTVDKHRIEEVSENSSKIEIDQVPVSPIRLLEKQQYTVDCCKSCRGDFLLLMKQWANGQHVKNDEDQNTGIFVRHAGKNVEITQEEFYRRKQGEDMEDILKSRKNLASDN